MILNARLTIEGPVGLPPVITLALGKEEARTFSVRVRGLPLGVPLVRLVWAGKVSDSDADGLIKFQKDVTSGSNVATVGRITDDGSVTGTAVATVALTATDLPDALPSALVSQLRGVLGDGREGCCAIIDLTLSAPIPLTLP